MIYPIFRKKKKKKISIFICFNKDQTNPFVSICTTVKNCGFIERNIFFHFTRTFRSKRWNKEKIGMTISVTANKGDNVFNIAEMLLNTITVMSGQKVARVPFHVHAGQSH